MLQYFVSAGINGQCPSACVCRYSEMLQAELTMSLHTNGVAQINSYTLARCLGISYVQPKLGAPMPIGRTVSRVDIRLAWI